MELKKALESKKASGFLDNTVFHLVLVAALAVVVYSGTLRFPFQWRDSRLIAENPVVQNLDFALHPSKAQTFEEGLALKGRYVGFLTFALNYRAQGTAVAGYRAVNIAIHIMNALLVYLLVLLVLRTPAFEGMPLTGHAKRIALFSSLLFVSHPVQTEAVTYIVQRPVLIVAFFYLASLAAYAAARLQPRRANRVSFYILSLASAVLAMKSRENAFTLPIMIALFEFVFFRGPLRPRVARLAPFLLTLLIVPVTVSHVGRPAGEVISATFPAVDGVLGIPPLDYLFTELKVIVTYIRLLFLPVNQSIDYDHPIFGSFFDLRVFMSALALLGALCFAGYLLFRGRSPLAKLAAFGILWFFVALLVESSVIPLPTVINEHRVYLPGVGVFVGVSAAAVPLLEKLSGRRFRANYIALLLVAATLLSAAAYKRNLVWRDGITLWQDVMEKSPFKVEPYNHLGAEYAARGDLLKAFDYYQAAYQLDPRSVQTHVNLGNIFSDSGQPKEAIDIYLKAIELDPEMPGIYYNLGVVYERMGDFRKAIEQYKTALTLDPGYAQPRIRMHEILRMAKEREEQSKSPAPR